MSDALNYHEYPIPGKISIQSTKPCESARDLSLAYSPGVAEPCLEIAKKDSDVYRYTSKGNLVAVITNGTAVLGLGNIGPLAAKPVMEGKGVLFKTFADIDVFDIELDCKTPDEFINVVKAMAPTFGGINLEDIKAPECFIIEKALKEQLDIPVFHDDQHGTAIISAAALLSALEITNKDISKVKMVVSGAGAAAIACCELIISLGFLRENICMCDSKGVIYKGRTEGMNPWKEDFAIETDRRDLNDAMVDADVFLGLSMKDLVTPDMLLSMAKDPIVFAMANPDPEIDYNLAVSTRSDIIMATGRSDFPNQVNNVLGFPFLFRGALDVMATGINEEMKKAAVYALTDLAKQPLPESVKRAYGNQNFVFGREYLIPKPFDPRVLYYIAPAVAKAAMESGVARQSIDINKYTLKLKGKLNQGRVTLRAHYEVAKKSKNKRVAYTEGSNPKVIRAAIMAKKEGIADPILIGKESIIREEAKKLELDISSLNIIEPPLHHRYPDYVAYFYSLRNRYGITPTEAQRMMRWEHVFANTMLSQGDVEAVISGIDRYYPDMLQPIIQIVGLQDNVKTIAGLNLVTVNDSLVFVHRYFNQY